MMTGAHDGQDSTMADETVDDIDAELLETARALDGQGSGDGDDMQLQTGESSQQPAKKQETNGERKSARGRKTMTEEEREEARRRKRQQHEEEEADSQVSIRWLER